MRVSEGTYIVIKGSDWLNSRLDAIGYSPSNSDRVELIKRIWRKDKTVSNSLIKNIMGSGNNETKT